MYYKRKLKSTPFRDRNMIHICFVMWVVLWLQELTSPHLMMTEEYGRLIIRGNHQLWVHTGSLGVSWMYLCICLGTVKTGGVGICWERGRTSPRPAVGFWARWLHTAFGWFGRIAMNQPSMKLGLPPSPLFAKLLLSCHAANLFYNLKDVYDLVNSL